MTGPLDIALGLVKKAEGCRLTAYRDPKWHGIKRTPENWSKWGKPWTIGWGETLGVSEGDVWTQERADTTLERRMAYFLLGILKRCPQLHLEPPGRVAACLSLAYNIGLDAFASSSICALTRRCDYEAAARVFPLWNKAGGRVMPGLVIRREHERKLYLGQT